MISINSTTVLVSWIPPFTLEGVPILGYNVTFYINGENDIISIEKYITMQYYSFGHPFLQNDLVVTVIPINEVGAGKSEVTTLSFSSHNNIIISKSNIYI